MLTTAGFDVEEAADGRVGLACYRQHRSDVVITDILMPEREGFRDDSVLEVANRLSQSLRVVGLFVVFLIKIIVGRIALNDALAQ